MSYTVINFKTKKQVREAVVDYNKWEKDSRIATMSYIKQPIRCYNPGLGPDLSNYTGRVSLEGPHYPKAHTWYAEGEMVNGILVKVK